MGHNALKYFYYRLKWFFAQYMDFKKPIHIDIELNNNCNQKCLSCWHNDKPPFKLKSLSIHTAYWWLVFGRRIGCMSVKFNLRGEPLLYKHLVDVICYAKQLGYVDIMINTNGILLDQHMCKRLSDAGLTTCIISVDSLVLETYCAIHNTTKDHYIALVHNIEHLQKKHNYFKIILNFHVNKYNKNENVGKYKKEIKWARVVVRDTQKRLGKDISVKQSKKHRKKRCPHMQRRVTVTVNGNIYPCCVCYNEPEDIKITGWDTRSFYFLRENYKNGIYLKSCSECTSGDIWR